MGDGAGGGGDGDEGCGVGVGSGGSCPQATPETATTRPINTTAKIPFMRTPFLL